MKRVLTVFLLAVLLVAHTLAGITAAANSDGISVLVDGKQVAFDQPPRVQDGRTLVPVRAIFDAMGARVYYDSHSNWIRAYRGNVTVTLEIGNNVLNINGKDVILDVPAQIYGDRTFVPARAVAEAFRAEVEWEQNSQTVTIKTNLIAPTLSPQAVVTLTLDDFWELLSGTWWCRYTFVIG